MINNYHFTKLLKWYQYTCNKTPKYNCNKTPNNHWVESIYNRIYKCEKNDAKVKCYG